MVSPDAPIIGAVDVDATAEPPVAAFVISISFVFFWGRFPFFRFGLAVSF